MRAPICLHAFRCAYVRNMFRSDPRYAETIKDKEWRSAIEEKGCDIRHEVRKLRAARARDARMIREHTV